MKNTILFVALFLIFYLSSNKSVAQSNQIRVVSADSIINISKNNKDKKTVIVSFGIWCKPCIREIDSIIELNQNPNISFYVLLIDKENSIDANRSIKYLYNLDKSLKILLLDERYYDYRSRSRRYKKFVKEITPSTFKIYYGMSKFFVLEDNGEVIYVSNYKDYYDRSNDTRVYFNLKNNHLNKYLGL